MLKSRCMKIICTVLTTNKTTKLTCSFFFFIISCKHSWSLSLPPTRTPADLWCCLFRFQFPLIYIETPLGTRVAQWNDEESQNGLVQLEFQLSEEPTLVRETCQTWEEDDLHAVMMKTIQSITVGYEDSIAISSFCTFSKIHTTSFDVEA